MIDTVPLAVQRFADVFGGFAIVFGQENLHCIALARCWVSGKNR
jgi:hypothetical protein